MAFVLKPPQDDENITPGFAPEDEDAGNDLTASEPRSALEPPLRFSPKAEIAPPAPHGNFDPNRINADQFTNPYLRKQHATDIATQKADDAFNYRQQLLSDAAVQRQQREAEKLQAAQQKQALNEENSVVLAQHANPEHENYKRPYFKDPANGKLTWSASDEQWAGERTKRNEWNQRRLYYGMTGRPFTTDKETGEPVPHHSDDQWNLLQQRKHLMETVKAFDSATKDAQVNDRPLLNEKKRGDIEKQYREATRDAVNQHLLPPLATAAKETAGGFLGFGKSATDEAKDAAKLYADLSTRMAEAEQAKKPVDLKPDDLALLGKSNPDAAAKIKALSDSISSDDQNRKWHEERSASRADLMLRLRNPEAWKQKHLRDIASASTPEEANTLAETHGASLPERIKGFDARARQIADTETNLQNQFDAIHAANDRAVSEGIPAGQITMLNIGGKPVPFRSDLADALVKHQQNFENVQKVLAPAREALSAEARNLQDEHDLAQAAKQRADALTGRQLADRVARSAANPSLAPMLKDVDALHQEMHDRAQQIITQHGDPEDPANTEAQAAMTRLQQEGEQRAKQLDHAMQYNLAGKEQAAAGLYEKLRKENLVASNGAIYDKAAGKPEEYGKKVDELVKQAGVDVHGKPILSRDEADFWLKHFAAADFSNGNTADAARVGPDGTVHVNPKFWIEPEKAKAAILASKSDPASQQEAIARLPQMEQAGWWHVGKSLVGTDMGLGEYFVRAGKGELYRGLSEDKEQTPEEAKETADLVKKFAEEGKKGAGWWRNVGNQLVSGVRQSVYKAAGGVMGLIGFATGDKDFARFGSEFHGEAARLQQAVEAIPGGHNTAFFSGLASDLAMLAVPSTASFKLARAFGASDRLAAAAGRAANTATFAAQSTGDTFVAARDAYMRQGMSEAEANSAARGPAAVSGAIAAGIFGSLGHVGFGSLFNLPKGEIEQKISRGILETAKQQPLVRDYLKSMGAEALKLTSQHIADNIVAQSTYARGEMKPEDIINGATGSAIMGALFGALGAHGRRGQVKDYNRKVDEVNARLKQQWADDLNERFAGTPGFEPVTADDHQTMHDLLGTPEIKARESELDSITRQHAELAAEIQNTAPKEKAAEAKAALDAAQARYDVESERLGTSAADADAHQQAYDELQQAQQTYNDALDHDHRAKAATLPATPSASAPALKPALDEAQARFEEAQQSGGDIKAAQKNLDAARDAYQQAVDADKAALADDLKNAPHREFRRKLERLAGLEQKAAEHQAAIVNAVAEASKKVAAQRVAVQDEGKGGKSGADEKRVVQPGKKTAAPGQPSRKPDKTYHRTLNKAEAEEVNNITAFLHERRNIPKDAAREFAEHHIRSHSTSSDYRQTAVEVEQHMKIAGQGDVRQPKIAERAVKALRADIPEKPANAQPETKVSDLLDSPEWEQKRREALAGITAQNKDGKPDALLTGLKRKKAVVALRNLDDAVARLGKFFPGGVRLADDSNSGDKANINSAGGLWTSLDKDANGKASPALVIHLPKFLEYYSGTSQQAVRRVVLEEFGHRLFLSVIPDADAHDFVGKMWSNEAGRELLKKLWKGYKHVPILQGDLPATLDETTVAAHGYNLLHEFIERIFTQRRFGMDATESHDLAEKELNRTFTAFLQRENAKGDPDSLFGSFLKFLKNFVKRLAGLKEKLPIEMRSQIDGWIKQANQLADDIGAPRAKELNEPASKGVTDDTFSQEDLTARKPTTGAGADGSRVKPAGQEQPPARSTQSATSSSRNIDEHAVTGKDGIAYTDQNDPIAFKWAVAEASDLVVSNHDTGAVNPDYPGSLQPRDRSSAASQAQVQDIATNSNFDRLSHSNLVSDGAPIVGPDSVVESGNGRLMGLRRSYTNGFDSSKTYRGRLLESAESLGIDRASVEKMKQPVLVRVRTTPLDEGQRTAFTQAANVATVAPMRETETARRDAGNLTPELLSLFSPDESGNLLSPDNHEFIRAFVRDVIPPNERAAAIDGAGKLSQSGLRRLRNALFTAAYGRDAAGQSALSRLTEATDDDSRNLTGALTQAAPVFAEQKARMERGALHADLDIAPDIAAAVSKLNDLKSEGTSVADWLAQDHIPGIGDDLPPVQRDLLKFLSENARSSKKLRDALARYQAAVEGAGNPQQAGLFGEDTRFDKAALWNLAANHVENPLAAGRRLRDELLKRPELSPGKALKVYQKLFALQKSGAALNRGQKAMLEQAERALGQHFMFDDVRSSAPAEDLRLESEADTSSRAPQAEQLALFAGKKLRLTDENRRQLEDVFGKDYEADESGAPVIARTLPDGHELLQPTAEKSHAIMPEDHILVRQGLLPAGQVKREQLHRAMIAHFIKAATPLPEFHQPSIYILAGGSGAGKTTIRRLLHNEGVLDETKAVVVGADEFRALLPEMQQFIDAGDGRGSQYTGAEAAAMVPKIMGILTRPGRSRSYNIILDSLMASKESLGRIAPLQEEGFAVHLIGGTVDPREAVVRTFKRAKDTGRWVAAEITAENHRGANANLPELMDQADYAYVYDNTPPAPQLIATKSFKYGPISVANEELFATIKQRGKEDEEAANQQDTGPASESPRNLQPRSGRNSTETGDSPREGGSPSPLAAHKKAARDETQLDLFDLLKPQEVKAKKAQPSLAPKPLDSKGQELAEQQPAPLKSDAPATTADPREWWTHQLTDEGRREALIAAGLPGYRRKVAWHYFDEGEQAALAAVQKNGQPPAPQPSDHALRSKQLASRLNWMLAGNGRISPDDLFEAADKEFGGTMGEGRYTAKDAYDALELAINQHISRRRDEFDPSRADTPEKARAAVAKLKDLLKRVPTQTRRTQETDDFQQFSTVPSLAYMANWAANVRAGDVALEPSAGVGGLATFAEAAGARVVMNELSPRRRALLLTRDATNPAHVHGEDAEQIDNILPTGTRPNVVVMNPPFSNSGTRGEKKNTAIAARHIEQALARLEPGGRLVAIVGEGMADDRPAFRDWWDKIARRYNVRANIGVSGQEYAKYGTTFDNQLVVIDKTPPTGERPVTGRVDKVDELPALLQAVRDERPASRGTLPEDGARSDAKSGLPGGGVPDAAPKTGNDSDAGSREPAETGDRVPEGNQSDREPGGSGADRGGLDNAPSGSAGTQPDGRGEPAAGSQPGGKLGGLGGGSQGEGTGTGSVTPQHVETRADAKLDDSVFDTYKPRVTLPGAKAPPAELSESAAMAAVDPPKATYVPSFPKELYDDPTRANDDQRLSYHAIESAILAGQAHQQNIKTSWSAFDREHWKKTYGEEPPEEYRKGFFIGDGTGTGKGRQVAAIMVDSLNQGRNKHVWITADAKLHKDAVRDLNNVAGLGHRIFKLDDHSVSDRIARPGGVLFTTYATLRSKERNQKKGAMPRSRVDQIVDWLGKDFDGVIAFDESHKMGNAMESEGSRGTTDASQSALAGLELQRRLPKARVVYFSATGATEVSNLAYAERLGLWGPGTEFRNREDFVNKIGSGGVAAMELVAQNLKAMGLYVSRALSWNGVGYDRASHELTPDQRENYNSLADAWQVALQNMEDALQVTGVKSADGSTRNGQAVSAMRSRFWSAHQQFFNQIITAMKMPTVIAEVERALKDGKSPVLQLVNTQQAAAERAIKDAKARAAEENADVDYETLDMTPRGMLMQMVEHAFPIIQQEIYVDEEGNEHARPAKDSQGNPIISKEAVRLRNELLDKLSAIRVPSGPLEMLLDHFGVDNVAEVTGRTQRVVWRQDDNGAMQRGPEKRSKAHALADARDFDDGKKRILVFSDAGGTGAGYHPSRNSKNQAQREHILVQPGWRANNAVQGFGRTHRNDETSKPHYLLVDSGIIGEKRFMSSIARRLDQLGALTKGQRQTGSQGFFQARDNLESTDAHAALQAFYTDAMMGRLEGVSPDVLEQQMGLKMRDKEGNTLKNLPPITQFLNRLLSLRLELGEKVFEHFSDRLDRIIEARIASGTLDQGLENITGLSTKEVKRQTVFKDPASGASADLVHLQVEQPADSIPWDKVNRAVGKVDLAGDPWFRNRRTSNITAITGRRNYTNAENGRVEQQVRATTPRGSSWMNLDDFTGRHERWNPAEHGGEPQAAWEKQHAELPQTRTENIHLITGTMLPIWTKIPGLPRVMRAQTDEGRRMIGRLIPPTQVEALRRNLGVASDTKLSGEDAVAAAQFGGTARMSNGWRLKKTTVAGEKRIEVTGPTLRDHAMLDAAGIVRERHQFTMRYYLPVGKEKATLEKVLQDANLNITEATRPDGTPLESAPRLREDAADGEGFDERLRDVWNRYDDEGAITFRDLVDEVKGIAGDTHDPRAASLLDAVERFEGELRDDLALAGRNDMDSAEEAFTDALHAVMNGPVTPLVDAEAHTAATSPFNDHSEPTEAQKLAGNYRKGHTRISGLDLSIENPAGSERSGVDRTGKPWRVEMKSHYGYVKGSEGRDGDHIDVFVKPGTPPDYDGPVHVVNQIDPATGKFDEHKAVIGVSSKEEARELYNANYAPGWKGAGSIVTFPMEKFKKWATMKKRVAPARETGRAQPLSELISSPAGLIKMGAMTPDVQIHAPDRSTQTVVQVTPQGIRPVYRVTLEGADNHTGRFTKDHLFVARLDTPDGESLNLRLADIIALRREGRAVYLPVAKDRH